MEEKELICIGCPMGCRMTVTKKDNEYQVQGNTCPRGEAYAKKELTNPTRIVTSTVKVTGGEAVRVSVKTATEIPKGSIMECMNVIRGLTVQAPVSIGDVLCENIAGTGSDLVATKEVIVLQ